ncbi:ATP-binding protein, partial [Streptococcus pneumoniae]
EEAKWALEVAAAGRHHMFLHGPPGAGKTMLASRLPGLLPDLEPNDALEVSAVHSLAGFDLSGGLVSRPPYVDPHHSASVASIVGGGPRVARPGAISCAHRGVLFLDKFRLRCVHEYSEHGNRAARRHLLPSEQGQHRAWCRCRA